MNRKMMIYKAKQLYYKPQVRSLLFNAIVLVLVLLTGAPHYEYDMDVMMQAQLFDISGAWPTGMIVFSNLYLGRFLKLLGQWMTGINVYTVFQYVISFIALWKIGDLFLQENLSKIGNITFLIFDAFIGYECYICPSYMKTAAILAVSGVYVCWKILTGESRQKKWAQYLYIGISILVAGMISWKSLLLSGILVCIYMIAYLVIRRIKVTKTRVKEVLIPLVCALIVLVVLQVLDNRTYQQTDGWMQAYTYRNAVEQAEMFGTPAYREELGQTLGLQEYQYSIMVDGHCVTPSQDTFEKLKDLELFGRDLSWENILRFMRTVPISLIRVSLFYGMLVLWILLFFSSGNRKKRMLTVAVIGTGTAYFLMFILASCNTSVVHFLILLPVGMCALMNGKDMQATKEERHSALIYLALGAIVLYSGMGSSIISTTNKGNINEDLTQAVEGLGQPWHAICLNEYLKSYSAFCRYDESLIADKNLVVIDGAYTLIPLYNICTCPAGWNIDQPIDNVNIGDDFMIWMHVM